MTLDEAALRVAKSAHIRFRVYRFYTSPLDATEFRYALPDNTKEHPMVIRAREMLQDWERYATPDDIQEIEECVRSVRDHLMKEDPIMYSKVLRPNEGSCNE